MTSDETAEEIYAAIEDGRQICAYVDFGAFKITTFLDWLQIRNPDTDEFYEGFLTSNVHIYFGGEDVSAGTISGDLHYQGDNTLSIAWFYVFDENLLQFAEQYVITKTNG